MKFPKLLICFLLYPFLFSQLATAQDSQIYLDSNHILLGENYALVNYDSTTDVLAPSILAPNYSSSRQHIVIYNNCSSSTLANAIEILPTNASGLVCDNLQQATYTVSSSLINYSYQFFVNGVAIQGPSSLTTFTHTITSNATITVIALPPVSSLCSQTVSLFQTYKELDPGSISGGGTICNGNRPAQITAVAPVKINGVSLAVSSALFFYTWESSLDGEIWTSILDTRTENYQPTSLTQTTYFRRKVQSTTNALCFKVSNQVRIEVLPVLRAGAIEQADQLFCLGELLPTLTVSNSTEGGNIQYQWQASTSAGATYTNIPLAVGENFTPSNITTTTLYRRATFSTAGSGCETFTPPIRFSFIDLDPGHLDAAQSKNICYNEIPALISNGSNGSEASSNAGSITYAWQESTDNINWRIIAGENQSSYAPPSLQTSTYFRRVAINRQGSYSCSQTTNSILIRVYNEVEAGNLLGDQVICDGRRPNPLSLSGTTSATGIRYQWQMSTDNVNFSRISNSLPTLSFPATATWLPMTTTYYRVQVRDTNILDDSCRVFSNAVEVFVAPSAEVIQESGPGPQQVVCPGDAMIPASFSITGSATTLSAIGLSGSGLSLSGPDGNGKYTLTGTPTTDVAVTLTAEGINPCSDGFYQYSVIITSTPSRPDYIRRGLNTAQHTIFQSGGLWYNNTFCQNINGATVTSFFPFEMDILEGSNDYEWKVAPGSAGFIDATTGRMTWNSAFFGTAIISVRALGCAQNSAWLDTRVEVIQQTNPPVVASSLSFPSALTLFLGDDSFGGIPKCQITQNTPNTQFIATTANGTSDYRSIQWSVENIVAGGGEEGESNPGTIDFDTGVMHWNPNFYGSLDIKAEAVNCDGNIGATSVTTVQIAPHDDSVPSILTVSPTIIPNCPPQENYISRFISNRAVEWSIDNRNAGIIIATSTNTAELHWKDDFTGTVRIRAATNEDCAIGESEIIAMVPGSAKIETLPALSELELCEGEALPEIPFTISGFPSSAKVSGLPNGITGTLSASHHIIDYSFHGTPSVDDVYTLEFFGYIYQYTVKTGDLADDIVIGLSNRVMATPNPLFSASRDSSNTLQIRAKEAGATLRGTVFGSNVVIINPLTISNPKREFILSGTLKNAPPGQYDYEVSTAGGTSFCKQASIAGRITVLGTSSLTLEENSFQEQTICDFDTITPIRYSIQNANGAQVSGLPPGVSFTASSTQVQISGAPQLNTSTTTVYSYTVTTTNNNSGCLPEASRTGTITVTPKHSIELTSAMGSDHQSICSSGPLKKLIPIVYTFDGGAVDPPIITGEFPPGVVSRYDAENNRLTITGIPTTNVSTQTIYHYGITTSGLICSTVTLSGTIEVNPNPRIQLLSDTIAENQTGDLAVCNSHSIVPIRYELIESPSFTITGLPGGVSASQSGNTVTISGSPNISPFSQETFRYTLTTNGSECQPETYVTGEIEVIPVPQINTSFIQENDVIHVQCAGANNGAIRIPTDSPDLDARIQGGQSPTAQVEEIRLSNAPVLGDEYQITINDIDYRHTVIASSFGGPSQSIAEVRNALINAINNAVGSQQSPVTASLNTGSSIRLTANQAGIPFRLQTKLQTSYMGVNTPTMTASQVTANVATNYLYTWSGPANFSSSSLQIENLSAGEYTLRVTAGSCFSEATFTVDEPAPITAVNELCNGAFKTTLSGGTAPYTLRLVDAFNNVIRTDTTNSIFNYTQLTPGANYRLEVIDATCSIPKQFSIHIPFELQFNPANVELTHDYCQQTPNSGDGAIVLGTISGNAFVGGSGNFSYQWSGPSGNFLTKDIRNLLAGDYTVTVTDNELGCTRSETFTIAANNPLAITLSSTSNLNAAGEIELSCANTASGVIQVNVTGGFGEYIYAWKKNGKVIPNSNVNRLEKLSEGRYTLTVTDVPPGGINLTSRCQLSQDFTIVSPSPLRLHVDIDTLEQALCSGDLLQIPVAFTGGKPPYNVQLNSLAITTSSSSYTFEELDPIALGETVTITVLDQNNCTSDPVSFSINVPKQYDFSSSTTNIDCSQGTLGAIQLTATPGVTTDAVLLEWYGDALHYFDTWENGNGLLNQIENPGTYTVSVSNQQGCLLYSSSFTIEDTSGQQLQVAVLQEISSTSCNENEGRIDLGISNGYPPYNIEWQIQSNSNTWTLLPEFNNQAIVTGLSSGTYRAIVSDSSAQGSNTINCSPVITTRSIEITDQRLTLEDFQIENAADLCGEVANGKISFGLMNTLEKEGVSSTLSLSFTLDGVELQDITFDEVEQRYEILDIDPGGHQLKILASSMSTTCQLIEDFTMDENSNLIVFHGPLTYTLDACSNGVMIEVGPNDISGGTPFSGNFTYDLQWQTFSNGVTQTFFGPTINNAQAGIYELMITDAMGCQHDTVFIEVIGPAFSPFSLNGTLANPDESQSEPVKALPVQCDSDQGGIIGIEVLGGLRPFEINWYKQNTNAASGSATYALLEHFKNQTYLSGLEPAKYKVEIRSLNEQCDGNASIYTTYEETIKVEENPNLFIVSGPFVDSAICLGQPGRISVEVFNNNQGELFFYYDGELVHEEENLQVNEQTHTLLIDSPKESATLMIINGQGCSLTQELNLELGEPRFSFTSPTYESSQLILARENITFTNLSTDPYVRSEWDFGDLSSPLTLLNTATSTKVNYSYPISGTYNVTLRIYNHAGCFLETTKQVAVGKGYSIMVPNVFSPNNDGINDFFRPLTTGLSTIRFSVYDQNGNLIYNENISEPDPSMITGIAILGWDGKNAPKSTYFIYTVEGLLHDGTTTVEKSGAFFLLQ